MPNDKMIDCRVVKEIEESMLSARPTPSLLLLLLLLAHAVHAVSSSSFHIVGLTLHTTVLAQQMKIRGVFAWSDVRVASHIDSRMIKSDKDIHHRFSFTVHLPSTQSLPRHLHTEISLDLISSHTHLLCLRVLRVYSRHSQHV